MTAGFYLDNTINTAQLIGRGLQFEALQNVLAEVAAGHGRCMLLSGEAGVGKSRLLREFRREAENSGLNVLQGNCFENDTAIPFAPLTDALRRFFGAQSEPADVINKFESLTPELVKLLPELTQTLPNITPTSQLPSELEKRRLFESLVQFFSRLAADRPLLLIIEDIHWSDETSLEFLYLFARRLSSLPAFLLLTARPQAESPPYNNFITQLNNGNTLPNIKQGKKTYKKH